MWYAGPTGYGDNDMINERFMPTDMIARARAQGVVDGWYGKESGDD